MALDANSHASPPVRPRPVSQHFSDPDDLSRYSSGQRRYSDAVKVQSKRLKDFHLISGNHYDALADFLENDTSGNAYDRTAVPHVVVKTVTKDNVETATFSTHSHPSSLALPSTGDVEHAHLIFLRGFTSPSWLNRICDVTNIRPEFFRRHLRFIDRTEFYDLPTLPSGSRDILRLRLTTICHRSVPRTYEEIVKTHKREEENILKHLQALSSTGRAGDSILRRYAVHNETTFTLEQEVSAFVKPVKHGWLGLVWIDVGRDLYELSPGKWFSQSPQGQTTDHTCLPIIQHPQKLNNGSISRDSDGREPINGRRLAQTATHLPLQYGASLDKSAILTDAMYGLSDLVAFAAASEKQFLNMIGAQIERDLRLYLELMEPSLTSLSHSKIVLDEHLRSSNETLACLRSRGGVRWPCISDEATDSRKKLSDDTVSTLIADYEALVSETQSLIQRCIEGGDLITNRTMLDESRRAVEQNVRVSRLTSLAFFFVPTSFVCSFFGGNFKEFDQGPVPIWIGVIVLSCFVIGSAAVCFSQELDHSRRQLKRRLDLMLERRKR